MANTPQGHSHVCPVHGDYLCPRTLHDTCPLPATQPCPTCIQVAANRVAESNPIDQKKPQALSTQQDKVDWLLANPHMWLYWPNHPECDTRWGLIVEQMRKAGLVSARARSGDIPLNKLIRLARQQEASKKG